MSVPYVRFELEQVTLRIEVCSLVKTVVEVEGEAGVVQVSESERDGVLRCLCLCALKQLN